MSQTPFGIIGRQRWSGRRPVLPVNPFLWISQFLLETVCAFGSWGAVLCCWIMKHRGFLLVFNIPWLLYVMSDSSLHPFCMLFMVLQTSTDNVPTVFSTPSWKILTYIGLSWKPFHISSLAFLMCFCVLVYNVLGFFLRWVSRAISYLRDRLQV